MKKQTHYRQGDVLIEKIDRVPGTARQQPKARRLILAHGEVTGHHHELQVRDAADWWKEGEISTANEKPSQLAGEIFVSLAAGGKVTHDEHATIPLPPGTYRVMRQREYHPEALRNVND